MGELALLTCLDEHQSVLELEKQLKSNHVISVSRWSWLPY